MKAVFNSCGLVLEKTIVNGHHPERFPFIGKQAAKRQAGPLYSLLRLISAGFGLGDGFEAYGRKPEGNVYE
jgi:hypothetical protein